MLIDFILAELSRQKTMFNTYGPRGLLFDMSLPRYCGKSHAISVLAQLYPSLVVTKNQISKKYLLDNNPLKKDQVLTYSEFTKDRLDFMQGSSSHQIKLLLIDECGPIERSTYDIIGHMIGWKNIDPDDFGLINLYS